MTCLFFFFLRSLSLTLTSYHDKHVVVGQVAQFEQEVRAPDWMAGPIHGVRFHQRPAVLDQRVPAG